MSTTYRRIAARELDPSITEAWRCIQSGQQAFASPYFCPEYTMAVGSVRGDAFVTVMEDAGRPVGFFPHQRSAGGFGRPVGGPLSDYHGCVVLPEAEWSIADLLRASRLGTWSFDHLVGNEQRFQPFVTGQAISPQMDLSSGYEEYRLSRRQAGSDLIDRTESKARKLAREVAEGVFEFHTPDPSAMADMVAWKQAQYRETKLMDAFEPAWTRKLLEHIAALQTPSFAGVCSVLRVKDKVVAVHMGMRSASMLHYWFPSYDVEFASYRTGIILLLRLAQAAASRGIRTIDLGKGESQYKQQLMNTSAPLLEGTASRGSVAATWCRSRMWMEARAAAGGIGKVFRLPVRVMQKLNRIHKYN